MIIALILETISQKLLSSYSVLEEILYYILSYSYSSNNLDDYFLLLLESYYSKVTILLCEHSFWLLYPPLRMTVYV